jgi:hypothetical protein
LFGSWPVVELDETELSQEDTVAPVGVVFDSKSLASLGFTGFVDRFVNSAFEGNRESDEKFVDSLVVWVVRANIEMARATDLWPASRLDEGNNEDSESSLYCPLHLRSARRLSPSQ